jgi:hypothetical protein
VGSAFIFEEDGLAFVGIEIAPGAAGVLQLAHLHEGDCPGVGAIASPLASVLDGSSFTILSMSQAEVLAGDFAINVHKSAAEAAVYVSCGEVGAGAAAPEPTVPGPAPTPTRPSGIVSPDTGAGPADGASAWPLVVIAASMLAAAGVALRLGRRVA